MYLAYVKEYLVCLNWYIQGLVYLVAGFICSRMEYMGAETLVAWFGTLDPANLVL